jgi:hypothetical protein
MPRLTPQELNEAKRRKAEQEEIEMAARVEREAAEAQQWAEQEEAREAARAVWRETRTRFGRLETMTIALYDEIDKLTKKAPKERLSPLAFDKVNTVIRAARELTKDHTDEFTNDIRELVQAGDMPEYRDALLTLREVREALKRFDGVLRRQWSDLKPDDDEDGSSQGSSTGYGAYRRSR